MNLRKTLQRNGIETMINITNITYCRINLLPYHDKSFSDYHDKSIQNFFFALSEEIRCQVFFATFAKKHRNPNKIIIGNKSIKIGNFKQKHYL